MVKSKIVPIKPKQVSAKGRLTTVRELEEQSSREAVVSQDSRVQNRLNVESQVPRHITQSKVPPSESASGRGKNRKRPKKTGGPGKKSS